MDKGSKEHQEHMRRLNDVMRGMASATDMTLKAVGMGEYTFCIMVYRKVEAGEEVVHFGSNVTGLEELQRLLTLAMTRLEKNKDNVMPPPWEHH